MVLEDLELLLLEAAETVIQSNNILSIHGKKA